MESEIQKRATEIGSLKIDAFCQGVIFFEMIFKSFDFVHSGSKLFDFQILTSEYLSYKMWLEIILSLHKLVGKFIKSYLEICLKPLPSFI